MLAILAIYVEHSKTLRSAETSEHHTMHLEPGVRKYKTSQTQEFSGHVIKEMSQKILDKRLEK